MATLVDFAEAARRRVAAGYYDLKRVPDFCPPRSPPSLRAALLARPGVVAEIKPASPTQGSMRADVDAGALARAFVAAGARGVSALAVDEGFGGSLANVIAASGAGAPVLFKDFVVDEAQVKAARRCGASAILLIEGVSPHALVDRAHALGLEVLLEVYDAEGYRRAASTKADLVGVNNRDLRREGLPVDASRAAQVLSACGAMKPTMALSGVETPADVARQLRAGARGVLVGSSLMRAKDPAAAMRALAEVVA
ncbi:MAG: indole-3-glycerol phosphate synthase [Thermoplasmata archaeon]|jgi:indole-3-glycerol phosphate synthase|nr:indole-3-glycerol phosphate synthase [Thermoplasmata archaeon]